MITQKKTANVLGGKTARACESCLKKRARWFCPADDGFLCHACDSLVHSANELAGRHKRVRLETASFKSISEQQSAVPSWHQGFTRKARTPRGQPKGRPANKSSLSMMPIVPEISSSDEGGSIEEEENEEHMIFSVPTFEPFEVELMNDDTLNTNEEFNISLIGFQGDDHHRSHHEGGCTTTSDNNNNNNNNEWHSFLTSDNDLAEFAADVESLLEQEPDEKMYTTLPLNEKESKSVPERSSLFIKSMESLLDDEEIKLENDHDFIPGANNSWDIIKMEDQEGESTAECGHYSYDWSMDVATNDHETLNFEVNYDHKCQDQEEEKKLEMGMNMGFMEENMQAVAKKRRKIFLRLNYEEVINAWAGNLSPWTTGRRPEFDLDHDGWPDCMGIVGPIEAEHQIVGRSNVEGGDCDREARVSRYREKRRNRLFSKKIRYEVRKLNAEKRPRLKGRFVKRNSLAPVLGVGPTFPSYLNCGLQNN